MSELQDMLRVQARLHRKQGANALADLFDNASKEIESLSGQLAKANERVRELEKRCSSHEKDMLRQCVFMEMTAEKLEQHREWQATAKVLRRPTRESKRALNKFAIEKKIEALDELSLNPNNESEDRIAALIDERVEQLRKEQSND